MNHQNLTSIICIGLGLLVSACQSTFRNKTNHDIRPEIRYSLIYMIHGDGSYLYHDSDGNAHHANKRILEQALTVAKNLTHAEVFIFHQRSRQHLLGLIPLHDGNFYYFRNGKLKANMSYFRDHARSAFDIEAHLFRTYAIQHTIESNATRTFFFYFGHQIPELGGKGYYPSYPNRFFNVQQFANELHRFDLNRKWDLLVLSSCNNGTPGVVSALSDFAKYLIASPENLHLSYMDTQIVEIFNRLDNFDLYHFARQFAQQAYAKLKQNTQTEITISLYDVDKVEAYLSEFNIDRESSNNSMGKSDSFLEYHDCQEVSFVPSTDGVDVFYRPPRFGREKNKRSHSGWGCGCNKSSSGNLSHKISFE